jgi:hypothetical protein
MTTMGHPTGMLVTGPVYYIKELAKAYYISADKLKKIADAIESGDTSGPQTATTTTTSRTSARS